MAIVLLASDGSAPSADAIRRGIDVLGRGHQFVAVAVVPPVVIPTGPVVPLDGAATSLPDTEVESRVEHHEEELRRQELQALLDEVGLQGEIRVTLGEPGSALCQLASELAADVVVIGAHHRGVVKRLLRGSVTAHVLNHAPCAVLAVPCEPAEAPND